MAQDVKNDIKKAIQVNTIPLIAVMTAVTTVLTMFVKIPTPTRGYLNLSDTMIFFSSYAFGPWVGGIIGGLGPALSDLISGYPQWAIFTFIIDGLQAVLVGLLVREFKPANVVIGSLVAFLGVAVLTAVQTPLFCGAEVFVLLFFKELYPF